MLIFAICIEIFIILVLRSYNIKIQSIPLSIICSFLFLLPIQAFFVLPINNNELTSRKRLFYKLVFWFVNVCYLLVVIGFVLIECGVINQETFLWSTAKKTQGGGKLPPWDDTKNLSTGIEYSFGGVKEAFGYTYNESKDNAPSNTVFSDGTESRIEYDALGRKNKDALYKNNTLFFKATYSFLDNASDSSKTSGLVSKIDYDLGSLEDLEYSYDSRGNITQIKKGGNLLESYTYDELNRLTRVDSSLQVKTIQYEYDRSGNITSKKEYPYNNTTSATISISYAYDDSNWKDKLTAYDGKAITYDAIGNPLSYNGKTFTWLGRRLNTYKSGSTTTSYTYNSDGIRTSKTVGSTKTEYFLNGSQILAQKTGSTTIPFYYDANGNTALTIYR